MEKSCVFQGHNNDRFLSQPIQFQRHVKARQLELWPFGISGFWFALDNSPNPQQIRNALWVGGNFRHQLFLSTLPLTTLQANLLWSAKVKDVTGKGNMQGHELTKPMHQAACANKGCTFCKA